MTRLFTAICCLVGVCLTGACRSNAGVTSNVEPESIPRIKFQGAVFSLGGSIVEEESWPWMAGLYKKHIPIMDPVFFCGGSLISREWILTAAHCMDPENHDNVDLQPHQIIVVIGSVEKYTHGLLKGTQQRLNVLEIIKHESYDPEVIPRFDYDIALLRIDPVEFSQRVRAISLPDPDSDEDLYRPIDGSKHGSEKTFPIVAGWGTISAEYYISPQILQSLAVPLRDKRACQDNVIGDERDFSERMICAGYSRDEYIDNDEQIRNACEGDSGGPLVRQRRSEDGSVSRYQIGICSWGYHCSEPGRYHYYTNVLNLANWISRQIHVKKPTLVIKSTSESSVKPCDEPQATYNGVYAPIKSSGYAENDIIYYTCDTGYATTDEIVSQCINREWSNPPPVCTIVPEFESDCESCKTLEVRPEGTIWFLGYEVYSPVVNYLPHRARVYVLCTEDYQRSFYSTCLNGQWSIPLQLCNGFDARCPDPGIPQYGYRDGDNFHMTKHVTFDCQEGYTLVGAASLTCYFGEWSDDTPSCRSIRDTCVTKECELWERCVTVNNIAECFCQKPTYCPQAAAEDMVCGSDNIEYDSECHLKAMACFFRREISVVQMGECPDIEDSSIFISSDSSNELEATTDTPAEEYGTDEYYSFSS